MNKSLTPSGFRSKLSQLKSAAVAVVAVPAAMISTSAFAAGESTGVIAVMTEYKEEAILIIIALAVVLWTLKATGLLKPR